MKRFVETVYKIIEEEDLPTGVEIVDFLNIQFASGWELITIYGHPISPAYVFKGRNTDFEMEEL